MASQPWLSVLVPLALRSDDYPKRFIESGRRLIESILNRRERDGLEIIFSDSGPDSSLGDCFDRQLQELRAELGITRSHLVYRRWPSPGSAFSRARALNLALHESSGEMIAIAHLDCEWGEGSLEALQSAYHAGVLAGGFTKDYDLKPPGSWLYWTEAWLNRRRAALERRLVGTNLMFLRRELALEHPLRGVFLEDVELSDWLRKRVPTSRWRLLPIPLCVSARKYRAHGELRAIAVNALVMTLFRLFRVGPRHLGRQLYRRRYSSGPLFWWELLSTFLRLLDKAGLGSEEWQT